MINIVVTKDQSKLKIDFYGLSVVLFQEWVVQNLVQFNTVSWVFSNDAQDEVLGIRRNFN